MVGKITKWLIDKGFSFFTRVNQKVNLLHHNRKVFRMVLDAQKIYLSVNARSDIPPLSLLAHGFGIEDQGWIEHIKKTVERWARRSIEIQSVNPALRMNYRIEIEVFFGSRD